MKRDFSKEFKRDAVSLVIDQGYSRVEAGKSLEIHPALLIRWVREHIKDSHDTFRAKGKLKAEQVFVCSLNKQVHIH
jgi:transposase